MNTRFSLFFIRHTAWATLCSLALAFLPDSSALAQGNKALMEEWARKKQQTKDEVYRELKRQGAVPKNGTITFEATVKPNPRKPDTPQVRIDSVSVKETPAGQKAAPTDPIFAPRDPQTGAVRETITVTNGVPDHKPGAKSSKP